MFKIKRDQIVGAVLVILGIVIFFMISDYRVPFTMAYPGPKALPGIAAFGFIACGIGIFVQSTLDKKPQKEFVVKGGWLRFGIAFGVLIVYVFLMKFLGFLIVTPFACFGLSTLFAKGKKSSWIARAVFSVVFTLFVYFLYKYGFSLPMPEPIWA